MEVKDTKGLGFIDPTSGRLRSQDELAAIPESSEPADTSNLSDTSVRSALSSVRARTSVQVNEFVNVLNQNVENLKDAKSVIKEQRGIARDLKDAIKSGDEEKAASLRVEFRALQGSRDEIANRVAEDNNRFAEDRRQSIRVGNEVRATFQTDEVRFDASQEAELTSVEDINSFLERSGDELEDLNTQISEERILRREVRQVNREVRNELNSIIASSEETEAINTAAQATDISDSLAIQIGSQKTIEDVVVSSIQPTNAEKLLKS